MVDQRSKHDSYFDGLVRWFKTDRRVDKRGMLSPFEFDTLPFLPRRVFAISDVPKETIRGNHAHSSGMQLMVCIQGAIEILLKFEGQQITLNLTSKSDGLLVAAGVWARQTYQDERSVLLVFADEPYSANSYLHS